MPECYPMSIQDVNFVKRNFHFEVKTDILEGWSWPYNTLLSTQKTPKLSASSKKNSFFSKIFVTAALDSCHGFLHLALGALYVDIVMALVLNVRLLTSVLMSETNHDQQYLKRNYIKRVK